MAVKFNFASTDNYLTRLTDINDTLQALSKLSFTGSENNLPTGAIRLNSNKFQSWSGSAWGDYKFDTLFADTINEKTSANGVVIDGVKLKDGGGVFTGNVGIGTSNPQENVAVYGVTESLMQFGNSTTGIGNNNGFYVGYNSSNDVLLWNWYNGGIRLGTNGTERMRITSDGNVGIGRTPLVDFDVYRPTTNARFFLETASENAESYSQITLKTPLGNWNILNQFSNFHIHNPGVGDCFIISSAGNTTVLNGQFINSGTYGTSPALSVSGAGTRMFFYPRKSAFRAGGIDSTQWDNANIGGYSTATGNGTIASGSNSTAMGYFTKASGSSSTAMGRDTTASGVYSTAMGSKSNASGNYSFAINLNENAQTGVGANIFRIDGATAIGGNVAWTNYSDRREKEDIRLLTSELDKINLLKPSIFKWKTVNEGVEKIDNLGLIAQEVREVYPEVVKGDEETEILSLEYTGLIAPIIKAIQELTSRLEILEKKG